MRPKGNQPVARVRSPPLMEGFFMVSNRRRFLIGAAATLICAPAIVRLTSLMPIRAVLIRSAPISDDKLTAGFVERLKFAWCCNALRGGTLPQTWDPDLDDYRPWSNELMISNVQYAAKHGFLSPSDREWWTRAEESVLRGEIPRRKRVTFPV
jgi:hypothetical protein